MKRLLIAILLTCSLLYAAEMIVKEPLKPVPHDATLAGNPVKDGNGVVCALLKINTDLVPFDGIDSNMRPVKVVNKTSRVWVYLSPGEKRLYLDKKGYARLIYDIPVTLESGVVYSMTILGGETASPILPISIITEPPDAEKWLDGKLLGTGKSFPVNRGSHRLEVKKKGFRNYRADIKVSENRVLFDGIVLEPIEPVMVTVQSQPNEAAIFIDNVPEGNTNKQIFKYPGNYHLRLIKGGYDPVETTIEVIESGANSFSYDLEKSTSRLSLRITPSGARVMIDNTERTERNVELAPGPHKIEVSQSGYDTEVRQIQLEKGKDQTLEISLMQQTGTLLFTLEPMEASVTLSNGETWTGSRRVTLPVGEYTATASRSGYEEQSVPLIIKNDRNTQVSVTLEKLPGRPTRTTSTRSTGAPEGFVYVPAGSFQMGRTKGNGGDDERPVHTVNLDAFYIGKYEVTQKEWKAVMGNNPSRFTGGDLPVEEVSWYDAVEFCNKLSEKEGLNPCYSGSGKNIRCDFTANGYRLPTEAEWESSARGATNTPDYLYAGSDTIGDVAWYDGNNSPYGTKTVGQKQANSIGTYDQSGNVWEWCWDWYDSDYYGSSPADNPTGPSSGSSRVLRGGHWGSNAGNCGVAYRNRYTPSHSGSYIGFRLCRTAQ